MSELENLLTEIENVTLEHDTDNSKDGQWRASVSRGGLEFGSTPLEAVQNLHKFLKDRNKL